MPKYNYLMQTWNNVSETWSDYHTTSDQVFTYDWWQDDIDNRRVLDNDTRAIIFQPDS